MKTADRSSRRHRLDRTPGARGDRGESASSSSSPRSSGSTPIDGLAPLTQVGGDATELLERAKPDVVLNAIVGFAGIHATLWALERGVTLALANKESLVAAGELARDAWARGGGLLLPVDSEHSAAFQLLGDLPRDQVRGLVLTASGGPFRGRSRDELEDVTPEDALAHPTWTMGPKITVDSATLANKGLELIEAHFLFDLPYDADRGRRSTRRRSSTRSSGFATVRALAHLGYPDMRVPDLLRPDVSRARARRRCSSSTSLGGLTLEFQAPDLEAFPLLALAREAGERGGTYPVRVQRRQRGRPCRRSSRGGSASSTSTARWRTSSRASTARRPATLEELVEADRSPREIS